MITLQFKDYDEMVIFSKKLLGGVVVKPEGKLEKQAGPKPEEVKTEEKEAKKEEAKKKEVKKEDPEEQTEEAVTDLTIEDVREVFVQKNGLKGNTSKLKAILTDFGVKKVTDLEEKDFDAVMTRLKEI